MNIIINPGSGQVPDASEANAVANTERFVADLTERGISTEQCERRSDLDEGGRFGFGLRTSAGYAELEMPGLPIDQVRWLGPGQDIWQFPRLYVDGNSWVWFFALNQFAPDSADLPMPNDTVGGGEPYRFEAVRLDASKETGA